MPSLAAPPSGMSRRHGLIALVSLVILLVAGGVFASFFADFEPPERRIPRLMREAAGLQPERHRGFGRQRKFDDGIREQYRRLLQVNRDYSAQVKKMDISKLRLLNAPASYVNPQVEKEGLAQLHALYDLDAGQEEKVRAIMGDLRHIVENYASSASEREALAQGFDNSVSTQIGLRQQALATEKAWVRAVDDLHAYADAHRKAFTASGTHLVFSDHAVRSEFQAKAEFQDEKRREFMALQQQFARSQANSLEKMGMSPRDIGK